MKDEIIELDPPCCGNECCCEKSTDQDHSQFEETLRDRIANEINRVSRENKSNTPDFILAEYLTDCLSAFEKATPKLAARNVP